MATPKKFFFLALDQVKQLHARHVNALVPLTQPNLLQSALDSPMNQKHYSQEGDLFKLAAILSEKLMKNHAFGDGNKRTALVAADMFFKLNGYILRPAKDSTGLENALVAVCTTATITDELAKCYKLLATKATVETSDAQELRRGFTEL